MGRIGCAEDVVAKIVDKYFPKAQYASVAENAARNRKILKRVRGMIDEAVATVESSGDDFAGMTTEDVARNVVGAIRTNRRISNSVQKRAILLDAVKRIEKQGQYDRMAYDMLSPEDQTLVDAGDAGAIARRNAKRGDAMRVGLMGPDAIRKNPLDMSTEKVRGSGNSLQARGTSLEKEFQGSVIHDLRSVDVAGKKTNLLGVANKGTHNRDTAQEMFLMGRGKKGGSTGNEIAEIIARAYNKVQDNILLRKNQAGAWIQKLPGYIVRQSHDITKLVGAGEKKWIDDLMNADWVDWFRTARYADTDIKKREALSEIYDSISKGKNIKTGSLADDLAKHRELHFKDGYSWFDYNEQYGSGNLFNAIIEGTQKGGRDVALLEDMGPDPAKAFEGLLEWAGDTKGNPAAQKQWQSGGMENILRDYMGVLDGSTLIPGNRNVAEFTRMIKTVNNMSLLGSMAASAIPDIANAASKMSMTNSNALAGLAKGWVDIFAGVLRGKETGEVKEILDLFGVAITQIIGNINERFNTREPLIGRFKSAEKKFFTATGMPMMDDVNKATAGVVYLSELGDNATKQWRSVNKNLKRMLNRYDIGEREWNIIREANETIEIQSIFMNKKQSMVTTRALDNLPDQVFIDNMPKSVVKFAKKNNQLTKRVAQERNKLSTTLRTYITDRVNNSIATGSPLEASRLRLGTQPGTPGGAVVSLMTQFKTFPMIMMRLLNSEIYSREGVIPKMVGAAHFAVATTILGGAAFSIKDLVKGRGLRDFKENPYKTLMAAVLQGGGLGIIGDLFYAAESRYQNSILATLAGPTGGMIEDAAAILFKEGKPFVTGEKEAGPAAQGVIRRIKQHAPYQNWILTRAFTDFAFDALYEELRPGYNRKRARRFKKEYGQKMILNPGPGRSIRPENITP